MNGYWDRITNQRLTRRRALAATGSLGVAAAFLAACGSDGGTTGDGDAASLVVKPVDTTAQAVRGGVMKDRLPLGDPPTLDIYTANNPLNAVATHAYSTLVGLKQGYLEPTKNEIGPDLAESWETSPDGLQITMKIRQGVKWHNKAPVNGRALDIEDITTSWDRFARRGGTRAAVVNSVDPKAPILSFTATDDRTIVIKLKEPLVYALHLFASNSSGGIIMVPKEADSGLDLRSNMIGTGPFVMSNYTPSASFTFSRHPEYWDKDAALIDQVEMPIMPEYASAVSQFKAGNIYSFGSYAPRPGVLAEDILPIKREQPATEIYASDLVNAGTITRLIFGWLPGGSSVFLDERVRQAASMSWDRDLYLETFHNIPQFEAEGIKVETRWNSAVTATYEGWWLDPKGSDFGPNAKYMQHDIAEAKKLLAAAGHPNGLNFNSNYVTGTELGNSPKLAGVLDGMASEAGFNVRVNSIDYSSEYIPKYRDGNGQFEGWGYKSTAGGAGTTDVTSAVANEWWSKGGPSFHGFSTSGQNDKAGDPQVESLIEKARIEQDTEKRRAMIFELQRYLAKPMYSVPLPGFATGFTMAWPAIRNFRVYNGGSSGYRPNQRLWIDRTKAPFVS